MRKTLALIALFAASSIACSDEMRSPTASSSAAASTQAVTLSPSSVTWPSTVTLTLTAAAATFQAGDTIYAGSFPQATVFDSATQLHCSYDTTPYAGGGSTPYVSVKRADVYVSQPVPLTIANPPAGAFTASPSSAALGSDTSITITGSNLAVHAAVAIDGTSIPVDRWFDHGTIIVILTSAQASALGAGAHTLTVVNPTPGGGGPAGTPFTIH